MPRKRTPEFNPIGTRIIVERDPPEDVTEGGIVLPDASQDKPRLGTVKAVGPGKPLPDGTRLSCQCNVGDRVLLSNFTNEVFVHDDVEYVLVREEDVLSIVSNL